MILVTIQLYELKYTKLIYKAAYECHYVVPLLKKVYLVAELTTWNLQRGKPSLDYNPL